MNFKWGSLLAGAVVFVRLLPEFLSLLSCGGIVWPEDKKRIRKWFTAISAAVTCCGNFIFYLFLHRLMLHRWNFLETVRAVVSFRFSWQDVRYLSVSLFCCTIFACVLGRVCGKAAAGISGGGSPRRLAVRQKAYICLIGASLLFVSVGLYAVGLEGRKSLVINEVCGNNAGALVKADSSTPDYVELYNRGPIPYRLDGLFLSDDENNLFKLPLGYGEIPAGEFALIELDPSDFALNKKGGEAVLLSCADKTVLDRIETVEMGSDRSYGRVADGGPEWILAAATPGRSNAGAGQICAAPVLSHPSGFYDSEFELSITAEPGTEIHYTLDGSLPTKDSPLYEGPIRVYDRSGEPNIYRSVREVTEDWENNSADTAPVDKAFIVRAAAVGRDGQESSPVSASYFVGLEEYRDKNVISLIVDPEDMWGENGIYVTGREYDEWYLGAREGDPPVPNFNKTGRDYEIEAYFEYFSEKLSFSQNVGLRIASNSNRGTVLKRFNVYARKEYSGSSVFDEPIFPGTTTHKFVIRGEYDYANAVAPTLVKGRDVAGLDYVVVYVFINGEFWYRTSIQEKYDAQFFETRYGISGDNLIVLKNGTVEEGYETDLNYWIYFKDYLATHDMSLASEYEEAGRLADLQSYIEYMCANIYFDNMDFTEEANTVVWRSRQKGLGKYADERWRWAFYDMDAVSWGHEHWEGLSSKQEKNTFRLMPEFSGMPIDEQPIWVALKQNPAFCRQFVLTFMDLVNTQFLYENIKPGLDAYGRDDISFYEDFFANRARYIVPYMAEEFQLTGTLEKVTLSVNDPEAGTIQLNTAVPELSDGMWSGNYYTDYPVAVSAVPARGYEFVRWEGSILSGAENVEVPVEKGGIELHAVFQKID